MNLLSDDCLDEGASIFYREFLAERDEILRHKWFESERAGHDIGFEHALLDWVARHRPTWRERRRLEHSSSDS
ncbi:MAG TPA: DUF4032 domain-containing protein [Chthoniobacter sp.]